MVFDLPFIWAGLIAFAVLAYVIFDGFDLGVGILFPLVKGERNRDLMMNSVAPVWDGNETWLVLGGGGLFAVFPLAYAIVMPALYAPIIAMLIGLIFRGVAFEFRFKARDHERHFWTRPLPAARWWPPFSRAWRWAPTCAASRWPTAPMPAGRWTGSRRSRSSPASRW